MTDRSTEFTEHWESQRRARRHSGDNRVQGRMLTRTETIETGSMLDSFGRPGFYILSKHSAKNDRYRNFEITSERLKDGRIRIRLILTRPELENLFSVLCSQMAEEAENWPSSNGGTFLHNQLKKWESLLKGCAKRLSEEQERGLFGELILLEKAVTIFGAAVAVDNWTGPENGPQDFLFDQGAVEVKTVFTRVGRVAISSLDQLDCVGPLYLCVGFIEKDPGGSTLKETVDRVSSALQIDREAADTFLRKLDAVGYNEALGNTGSDTKWALSDRQWFDAKGEKFPALRRSEIPDGVLDAEYVISLSTLMNYKTEALL